MSILTTLMFMTACAMQANVFGTVFSFYWLSRALIFNRKISHFIHLYFSFWLNDYLVYWIVGLLAHSCKTQSTSHTCAVDLDWRNHKSGKLFCQKIQTVGCLIEVEQAAYSSILIFGSLGCLSLWYFIFRVQLFTFLFLTSRPYQ